MADIDMTDAPPPKAKASKAAAEGSGTGDKKRFEVKKVRVPLCGYTSFC
jgi:RING-box protein 1